MSNLLEIINRTMRLKNYSPRTIKTYSLAAKAVYQYYHKPLGSITNDEITFYLESKLQQGCGSETIQEIAGGAVSPSHSTINRPRY